jgi:Arc/MetJ-type ribon-helix-helix transcriptional regulator
MANQLMHVRLSEQLYRSSRSIAQEAGYSSVQEFFRASLMKAIEEYELRQRLRKVDELAGSAKVVRHLTRKQRDELARDFIEKRKKGYNAFKELGIEVGRSQDAKWRP